MPLTFKYCGLLAFIASTLFLPFQSAKAIVHNNDNYGYIYWEHGTFIDGRQGGTEAKTFARNNPNLIIQTGYYSLRLDCDDMKLTGFDSLNGSDYITALNEDVSNFTSATLNLFVYKGGVRYQCKSAIIQGASGDQYVRIIENGQYVQRFDHMGLIFRDYYGNELGVTGRLEITAWPDRVGFQLDFLDVPGVTRTTIQLITPNGTQLLRDTGNDRAFLLVEPQNQGKISNLNASSWVNAAYDKTTNVPLAYSYNAEEAAVHIDIPASSVLYPRDNDRVDEFIIELKNPFASQQNLPLVFDQIPLTSAITGTVMVLCHENDGSPLGEPVQISKNWHITESVIHKGRWLRGSTMLTMAPNETKRLRLRVIYGYWAGAATASYSQLSLIGFGGNWKWDESALGAWGESLTIDPTQHLAGAFMADIRPTFTTPMNVNTSSYNWTENVGGGDFLIYQDATNTRIGLKRLKTAYKWTGPNLTEVLYSGITTDDKIRANYGVTLGRTNDYQRRFFDYKYEFLQNVTPNRLVYLQMAADHYLGPNFQNYFSGHYGGLTGTYTASPGGNTYKGSQPFSNRWVAIEDSDTSSGSEQFHSYRGLLDYGSTLNGSQLNTYLHHYGRTYGVDRTLFDLSANSTSRNYNAGDVVEGKLGLIMMPKTSQDYWGSDSEFAGRLTSHTTPWEGVYRELFYNRHMAPSVSSGTLLNNYPIEIQANNSSTVLAQFQLSVNQGVGHVPVILRDVTPGYEVWVQRNFGGWQWLEKVNIGQNDYYQGVMNANGKMDYCFNINRPTNSLDSAWEIRIIKGSIAD